MNAKIVRCYRYLMIPLDVPVNIQIHGEHTMRKRVRLLPHPTKKATLRMFSGGTGRPACVNINQIEKITKL